MNLFEIAIKAAWDEINTPESFVKGDEFESYVQSHLFPKDKYTLLRKTRKYKVNKVDFVESTKEPDYKFKSIKSGRVFFVEAKYRSSYFECEPYQLKRYKEIDKKTPVYILIGIGQQPSAPEQIFLVPVKDIEYLRLFRSFLASYEISVDTPVDESHLRF